MDEPSFLRELDRLAGTKAVIAGELAITDILLKFVPFGQYNVNNDICSKLLMLLKINEGKICVQCAVMTGDIIANYLKQTNTDPLKWVNSEMELNQEASIIAGSRIFDQNQKLLDKAPKLFESIPLGVLVACCFQKISSFGCVSSIVEGAFGMNESYQLLALDIIANNLGSFDPLDVFRFLSSQSGKNFTRFVMYRISSVAALLISRSPSDEVFRYLKEFSSFKYVFRYFLDAIPLHFILDYEAQLLKIMEEFYPSDAVFLSPLISKEIKHSASFRREFICDEYTAEKMTKLPIKFDIDVDFYENLAHRYPELAKRFINSTDLYYEASFVVKHLTLERRFIQRVFDDNPSKAFRMFAGIDCSFVSNLNAKIKEAIQQDPESVFMFLEGYDFVLEDFSFVPTLSPLGLKAFVSMSLKTGVSGQVFEMILDNLYNQETSVPFQLGLITNPVIVSNDIFDPNRTVYTPIEQTAADFVVANIPNLITSTEQIDKILKRPFKKSITPALLYHLVIGKTANILPAGFLLSVMKQIRGCNLLKIQVLSETVYHYVSKHLKYIEPVLTFCETNETVGGTLLLSRVIELFTKDEMFSDAISIITERVIISQLSVYALYTLSVMCSSKHELLPIYLPHAVDLLMRIVKKHVIFHPLMFYYVRQCLESLGSDAYLVCIRALTYTTPLSINRNILGNKIALIRPTLNQWNGFDLVQRTDDSSFLSDIPFDSIIQVFKENRLPQCNPDAPTPTKGLKCAILDKCNLLNAETTKFNVLLEVFCHGVIDFDMRAAFFSALSRLLNRDFESPAEVITNYQSTFFSLLNIALASAIPEAYSFIGALCNLCASAGFHEFDDFILENYVFSERFFSQMIRMVGVDSTKWREHTDIIESASEGVYQLLTSKKIEDLSIFGSFGFLIRHTSIISPKLAAAACLEYGPAAADGIASLIEFGLILMCQDEVSAFIFSAPMLCTSSYLSIVEQILITNEVSLYSGAIFLLSRCPFDEAVATLLIKKIGKFTPEVCVRCIPVLLSWTDIEPIVAMDGLKLVMEICEGRDFLDSVIGWCVENRFTNNHVFNVLTLLIEKNPNATDASLLSKFCSIFINFGAINFIASHLKCNAPLIVSIAANGFMAALLHCTSEGITSDQGALPCIKDLVHVLIQSLTDSTAFIKELQNISKTTPNKQLHVLLEDLVTAE